MKRLERIGSLSPSKTLVILTEAERKRAKRRDLLFAGIKSEISLFRRRHILPDDIGHDDVNQDDLNYESQQ